MTRYRRWGMTAAALALLMMSAAVPTARAWTSNPDAPGMPGHGIDDPHNPPPVDYVGDPDTGGGQMVYRGDETFILAFRLSPSPWSSVLAVVLERVCGERSKFASRAPRGMSHGR